MAILSSCFHPAIAATTDHIHPLEADWLRRIAPRMRGDAAGLDSAGLVEACRVLGLDQPGGRLDVATVAAILGAGDAPDRIDAVFALARAGALNLSVCADGRGRLRTLLARRANAPLTPACPSLAHWLAQHGAAGPGVGRWSDLAERFAALRAAGVQLDSRAANGGTPLHVAARVRNLSALDALIREGVTIDARDEIGLTPLMVAVRRRFEAGVDALLKAGADVSIVHLGSGSDVLCQACSMGNAAIVERLIQAGADVNAKGFGGLKPMHIAAVSARADIVAALIDAGVSPDVGATWRKFEPLHLAANDGAVNTILTLIAHGASPDAALVQSARTPLHLAAAANRRYAIEALVGAGANINACDAHGATPLHTAAGRGNAQAVRVLIRLGADIFARDSDGRRPIEWGGAGGYSAVTDLLWRAGDNGPFWFKPSGEAHG